MISITEQPWPFSVNVSVGSSLTINAAAIGTKDGIAAKIEKKFEDERWDDVPFYGDDISTTKSLSSTLSTGIFDDTSHSGEYRMTFYPFTEDRIGEEIGTASVTVTVTELCITRLSWKIIVILVKQTYHYVDYRNGPLQN